MSNIVVRTITGAAFIGLIIGAILWSPWAFFALFCLVAFGASFEFFSLLDGTNHRSFRWWVATLSMLVFALLSLAFLLPDASFFVYPFPLLLLVPIAALLSDKATESVQRIAGGLLAILLIATPLASLSALSVFQNPQSGRTLLLALFLTIWSYDTFAYLTGRSFGKHRMCEKISPKKTWEGAIGGVVFAGICCYVFYRVSGILSLAQWLGFSLIVSVVGTLGDLSESLLKRSLNVKDSGKILPGHGGLLDRFDSTLFAAPFILAYLYLLNY